MITALRCPIPEVLDVASLRGWLRECDLQGTRDMDIGSGFLRFDAPFRVLDATNGRLSRLQQPANYVALSYVWGTEFKKQTSALASGFIDMDSLPATIKDAMDLTLAIGQRYIWIDCLCIDQSRPEKLSVILANMGRIYEKAYLTIVAASGSGVEHGLSRVRGSRKHESSGLVQSASFLWHGEPICLVRRAARLQDLLIDSPWRSRGWTYQEYQMSSRLVVLTQSEVFFECSHGTRRRQVYEPRPRNVCPRPTFGVERGDAWRMGHRNWRAYCEAVAEFSRRKFTFCGDRLDAFAGIFQRWLPSDLPPAKRIALSGLPSNHFQDALAWQPLLSALEGDGQEIGLDTRGTQFLPTWSWAGWKHPVCYPKLFGHAGPTYIPDECNIVLYGPNEYNYHGPREVLSEHSLPLRCALHLKSKCLQVLVQRKSRFGKSDLSFTNADGFEENTYKNVWTSCPLIARQGYWLAFLEEHEEGALWLVLQGERTNLKRIGITIFFACDTSPGIAVCVRQLSSHLLGSRLNASPELRLTQSLGLRTSRFESDQRSVPMCPCRGNRQRKCPRSVQRLLSLLRVP